jgi:hypothetical protein
MFLIYCRYKVKKEKNLKALHNAILHRAAQSERKQRRIELIRGCLASRRVLHSSPKLVEGGDPHYPLGHSSCPLKEKDGWEVLKVTM